jgi:hypothetical protein
MRQLGRDLAYYKINGLCPGTSLMSKLAFDTKQELKMDRNNNDLFG